MYVYERSFFMAYEITGAPLHHRLELDVRLYLTHLETSRTPLWASAVPPAAQCGTL